MSVIAMKAAWKKMPVAEYGLNLIVTWLGSRDVKPKPAKITAGFALLSAG